ncbi:MAG: hypothetical protein KGJ73_03050 [Rhodospirillales bacterium]|nr:hypothetical protein [Rhodospirillales bacterium]
MALQAAESTGFQEHTSIEDRFAGNFQLGQRGELVCRGTISANAFRWPSKVKPFAKKLAGLGHDVHRQHHFLRGKLPPQTALNIRLRRTG